MPLSEKIYFLFMRLWSIHPKYLDSIGLVALWRESLLARKVLTGQTKGYRHHPQLERFRETESPLNAVENYLMPVYGESRQRGFSFDPCKIDFSVPEAPLLPLSKGQLQYEWEHLMGKLMKRSPALYENQLSLSDIDAHPLFRVVEGEVSPWEIRK